MQLLYLNPAQLEADPNGVRQDQGDIAMLAATIAEQGLLQPLGVVPIDNERYQVVYGGRRLAAIRALGLERVPCIRLELDTPDQLIQQLTENVARLDLNDLEKALAFARLRDQLKAEGVDGELDEAVGARVGLTGRTVRRYLGLLDLPAEVQDLLRSGELTVTQAQHLRRLPSERRQVELARFAADEGMSAAQISGLAAYLTANPELSVEAALDALEGGLELRSARPGEIEGAQGGQLSRTSGTNLSLEPSDNDLWDDEDEDDELQREHDAFFAEVEEQEAKRNKSRVFRIRSLDQMVDETDRMSRAFHEGDFEKWLSSDEGAPFKVRLLLKQLETINSLLRTLMHSRGWELE